MSHGLIPLKRCMHATGSLPILAVVVLGGCQVLCCLSLVFFFFFFLVLSCSIMWDQKTIFCKLNDFRSGDIRCVDKQVACTQLCLSVCLFVFFNSVFSIFAVSSRGTGGATCWVHQQLCKIHGRRFAKCELCHLAPPLSWTLEHTGVWKAALIAATVQLDCGVCHVPLSIFWCPILIVQLFLAPLHMCGVVPQQSWSLSPSFFSFSSTPALHFFSFLSLYFSPFSLFSQIYIYMFI